MKARKILIRVIFGLFVLIVAALFVRAVFNYTTGRRLRSYLETAKAEKIPLTMTELIADCPDSENAAQLWRAAEALLLVQGDDRPLLTKTIEDFFYGRALDGESRGRLVSLAERNRKVLDLMAEAAGRPCFRYTDWGRPAYEFQPSNSVKMIQATRLLAIDAVLHADHGDIAGALEECRAGLRLTRLTMDEPTLITTLVAMADMKALLLAFNKIVSGRDLDPDLLTAWMKDLDPHPWRAKFKRSVTAERIISLSIGLEVIAGKSDVLGKSSNGERLFYWLSRPIRKAETVWLQNRYRDLEKSVGLAYYQTEDLLARHTKALETMPRAYKLAGLLVPEFRSFFLKEATLEAMMLAAKAGLACKIYKSRNGRYPESLAALVPDLLESEPIDPFTGKPVVYRIQNGRLMIYSLGSNEKDDGGRGTLMITQLVMEKDDDWGWTDKVE